MPEEFAAASASHIFPKRHARARDPRDLQGIWTNEVFEYHGEFADFGPSGFGAKPLQKSYPPIYFSGLKDPKRSANRVAKYDLAGGSASRTAPTELKEWRGAIQAELEMDSDEVDGRPRHVQHDLVRHHRCRCGPVRSRQGQQPVGRVTSRQITDMLKRYQEAGLTMPMLWPPFADVSVVQDPRRHEAPSQRDHAEGQRRLLTLTAGGWRH
jgi:FMNH2-dependent dimethyl sulfone monooxygenase